jgi:hypothetical protein
MHIYVHTFITYDIYIYNIYYFLLHTYLIHDIYIFYLLFMLHVYRYVYEAFSYALVADGLIHI